MKKNKGCLKFEIVMKEGEVLKIDVFIKALTAFMGALNAVERNLTGKRRTMQKWNIVEMGITENKYFIKIEGATL